MTKFLKIFILFGTSVITARALGPEGLGYTKFLLLTLTTIAQFGSLGIIDATSYFQKKTKYSLEEIFKVNFTFLLLLSSILATVFITLNVTGIIFTNYDTALFIYLTCSLIFLNFLNDLLVATLISREKIIAINRTLLFSGIVNLLILSSFWISGTLTVRVYFVIFPLTTVVRFIVLLRENRIRPGLSFRPGIISDELKYGTIVYLGAFFIFLNYRLDQWLINFYIGNRELGLYAVGVALAEIILIVPTSVINPLRARLYNVENDNSEFKSVTAKTIKFALYATFSISLPLFFVIPLITSQYVYGVKFAESVTIVRILLAGIIFLTFGKVGSHYYVVKGKPLVHMLSALSIFIINFALNIAFIPRYGIKGAAAASSISYLVYGLIYVYLYLIVEKFPFRDLFVLKRSEVSYYTSKIKFSKTG